MLCQSDLILLHKWGLDDSQSHTTVGVEYVLALDYFGTHQIIVENVGPDPLLTLSDVCRTMIFLPKMPEIFPTCNTPLFE